MNGLVWSVIALCSILAGCAHVMSGSSLALVDRSASYTEIKAKPEALTGKVVLVGGIIAGTRSSGDLLQLEIMQLELFDNGVPDEATPSGGRFLVVSGDLVDPLLYRRGSLVTVIGKIKGEQVQKLDDADYRYPLISAIEIRQFRASDLSSPLPANPYKYEVGDERFMLRPAGAAGSRQKAN